MTKPARGAKRRHTKVEVDPYRTPYQRDRDRVLYSSAFRRLSGVAQVAAVNEQRVLHNRLTHSLKVAQLGRRLVQHLKHDRSGKSRDLWRAAGVNADVVETAGLVHDIGHPPFGHISEPVLNACLRRVEGLEGFEGNAQSFRIVTKLARRRTDHPGLDLTRATLDAMLKYPRTRSASEDNPFDVPTWTDRGFGGKWGTYRSELMDFRWARKRARGDRRSANAVLMDWADDITYATHDIEDYFRAGLIPLHNLHSDRDGIFKHACRRLGGLQDFDPARFAGELDRVIDRFEKGISSSCWDTRRNRSAMNEITTENLGACVRAVSFAAEAPFVTVDPQCQYLVEALKELTWYYVIDRPSLAVMQEGQKHIIQSLYDRLSDCLSESPKSPRLPIQLRSLYRDLGHDEEFTAFSGGSDVRRARAVVDYICVLTEAQAVDLDERLSGRSHSSMFGAWFS